MEIIEILPDFNNLSGGDEDVEKAAKKAGVTDEEIKEKLNNFDYDENYSEIEVKKINGKWELEYDFNTYLNEIMNGFNTNDD